MATDSAKMIWELVRLDSSAALELFQLDLTPLGDQIYCWFNGQNYKDEFITWQGVKYLSMPITVDGYSMSTESSPPRPKMTIANPLNIIGKMMDVYNDFVGMKVTRIRTRAKFIDAVNFPDNTNADASSFELPRDVYYVKRKASHTRESVQLELGAATDMITQFPQRMVTVQSCTAQYRDPLTCGYRSIPLTNSNGQLFNWNATDRSGNVLFVNKGEWNNNVTYREHNYVFLRQFPIGYVRDPDEEPDENDLITGETRKVYFVCNIGNQGKHPLLNPSYWEPDDCVRQLEYPGCKFHFPKGPLPFNAFPGCSKVGQY